MGEVASTNTLGARPSRLRRRFMVMAIVALAALAVALGVSFTADTGTTTVSVTAGTTSSLVYSASATLTGGLTFKVSAGTTATSPSWTPVAGSAGSVTSKGDIALIDARTASAGGAANLTVTIYVTNLAALQKTYSSFAWPIRLYSGKFTAGSPGTTDWSSAAIVANSDTTYLTNTGGFLSFTVPTEGDATQGNLIEVQLGGDTAGDGGSFYTTCTDTSGTCSGGSLSPTFFVTAQPS